MEIGNCRSIQQISTFPNFKISNISNGKSSKNRDQDKDQEQAAEAKNWTKVIKAVRSPKTGAYTFKEQIVHKDKIKEFCSEIIFE